jgi:hypothetical protein
LFIRKIKLLFSFSFQLILCPSKRAWVLFSMIHRKRHYFIQRDGRSLQFSWSHGLGGSSHKTLSSFLSSYRAVSCCIYDAQNIMKGTKQLMHVGQQPMNNLNPAFWITSSWKLKVHSSIKTLEKTAILSCRTFLYDYDASSYTSHWWPRSSEREGSVPSQLTISPAVLFK